MAQLSKARIRARLVSTPAIGYADPEPVYLRSACMVGGVVYWWINPATLTAEVQGYPTETEKGITTVDELTDHIWKERKRIIRHSDHLYW